MPFSRRHIEVVCFIESKKDRRFRLNSKWRMQCSYESSTCTNDLSSLLSSYWENRNSTGSLANISRLCTNMATSTCCDLRLISFGFSLFLLNHIYVDWAQITCVLTSTVVHKLWWSDYNRLQYICNSFVCLDLLDWLFLFQVQKLIKVNTHKRLLIHFHWLNLSLHGYNS